MSFPREITSATLVELLSRKELYSLVAGEHRFGPRKIARSSDHLKINSYQLFVKNLFNPATPYTRFHLSWAPGIGKTIGALVIAHEFVKIYKPIYAAASMNRGRVSLAAQNQIAMKTPSVFVLGFAATMEAFHRDLINYSYFGFVTKDEREELNRRRSMLQSGTESDYRHYREYYLALRRKIGNKRDGGFFYFLGYDAFVNRLFVSESGVTLKDIEEIARVRAKADPNVTLEDVMAEHINSGIIHVNDPLLAMMENGLLICDEIHETYNSMSKNNRGVAISYVLDKVPGLRLLTLSATPINNSPTEVVDFANYFITNPRDRLRKSDIFINRAGELRDGALDRIFTVMFGKTSFVQSTDVAHFPRREILGETVIIEDSIAGFRAGTPYPYLKFIQCPISDMQAAAIAEYTPADEPHSETVDEVDRDTTLPGDNQYFSVPSDGNTIYDMVFPHPTMPNGSFRSTQIRAGLSSASDAWKDTIGIGTKRENNTTVIHGAFLARDKIAKYSTKYARLLDELTGIYNAHACKIMLYHYRIEMSGVTLIGELLRANGYLDELGNASAGTLCIYCNKPLREHGVNNGANNGVNNGANNDTPTHTFTPIRFMIAHSKIDESMLRTNFQKFNMPNNADGSHISILIGGELIRQSYDFKDIQYMIIATAPMSLQTLLQIFGRAIRKNSHENLPPDRRVVHILILLQTMQSPTACSPEFYKYISKMQNHLITQRINVQINRGAVDANVNRDIIMSQDMLDVYFPNGRGGTPVNTIDAWYYEPAVVLPSGLTPSNVTYLAHNHGIEELDSIITLIKFAFTSQPVYTIEALWQFVTHPPVGVEINPATFSRDNFNMALAYLSEYQKMTLLRSRLQTRETLFDTSSKFIYIRGVNHSIARIANYYVAIPAYMRDDDTDRLRMMSTPPIMDAETYLRGVTTRSGLTLPIAIIDGNDSVAFSSAVAIWLNLRRPNDMLTVLRVDSQIAIIRSIIENSFTNIKLYPALVIATTLALFAALGALVSLRQVRKFEDISAIFGPLKMPEDATVGYTEAKVIQLYNGKTWTEIKKTAMNRKIDFREISPIIGSLEASHTNTRLKLRKSLEQMRKNIAKQKAAAPTNATQGTLSSVTAIDTRLVERGMSCETRSRPQLVAIAKILGVSLSNLQKIKIVCANIRDRMVELETTERTNKTKTKYLYGWWDDPVDIKSLI